MDFFPSITLSEWFGCHCDSSLLIGFEDLQKKQETNNCLLAKTSTGAVYFMEKSMKSVSLSLSLLLLMALQGGASTSVLSYHSGELVS